MYTGTSKKDNCLQLCTITSKPTHQGLLALAVLPSYTTAKGSGVLHSSVDSEVRALVAHGEVVSSDLGIGGVVATLVAPIPPVVPAHTHTHTHTQVI